MNNNLCESNTTDPLVYAIVSGKGGTGKSLLSTSIAYVLAHCGKKTLLVDVDLFTHGLTFFVLAEYPRRVDYSTSDVFKDSKNNREIDIVNIPSEYVGDNLFLAPSISKHKRPTSELKLNNKYDDCFSFSEKMRGMINNVVKKNDFDYVIVDTRGGTDATSIGAALASDGYIIVTEADKPSWDMGRLFIDTMDSAYNEASTGSDRIGFVINKNVLPSEAIEAFLRKEWQAPHLATIPLDENAVRYFQEDKVPTAESIGCPFSVEVLKLVRKVFIGPGWSDNEKGKFETLWEESKSTERRRNKEKEDLENSSKYAVLMRFYGTFISTFLLAFLAYSLVRDIGDTSTHLIFVIVSVLLIFVMTASDPKVLIKMLEMIFNKRK